VLTPNFPLIVKYDPARAHAIQEHEALHAVTGNGDDSIFQKLAPFGLPHSDYDATGNTDEITRWILAGCPGLKR
jgi:hypothetical protein